MDALERAFEPVEQRRKTLEVYAHDETAVAELEAQFSTRNVSVRGRRLPEEAGDGFVVVRDADGEFRGALGIEQLAAIVSPDTRPPWGLDASGTDYAELFDFLDNTIFTSYDRRQLLAVTREIEDRAWRTPGGELYVGFQRAAAFAGQRTLYERLATERDVFVRAYIEDEWASDGELAPGIDLVADAGVEIGRFWFLLFDDEDREYSTCGLLAEERSPGSYYGFWTNDPERVDPIVSYLESTIDDQYRRRRR